MPWNSPRPAEAGSYHSALEAMGVPGAKAIVDVVVLVAVASCLNSALYTASRMIYSPGRRGQAPRAVMLTTGKGVPRIAVLASTAVGFLTAIADYLVPEAVFTTLLATPGAIALLVYLVVAVSQLRLRAKLEQEGADMPVRMYGVPVADLGRRDRDPGDARLHGHPRGVAVRPGDDRTDRRGGRRRRCRDLPARRSLSR